MFSPSGRVGAIDVVFEQQALGHREHARHGAIADADLGVDALDVVAGRLARDHEPLGDLLVRQALGDEAKHLELPRRQIVTSFPLPFFDGIEPGEVRCGA